MFVKKQSDAVVDGEKVSRLATDVTEPGGPVTCSNSGSMEEAGLHQSLLSRFCSPNTSLLPCLFCAAVIDRPRPSSHKTLFPGNKGKAASTGDTNADGTRHVRLASGRFLLRTGPGGV